VSELRDLLSLPTLLPAWIADGRQVVALGRDKAFTFRISYPFMEEGGDGRALSERGCQLARDIGVLTPTRFQREQASF
jgi:hypothetical protein